MELAATDHVSEFTKKTLEQFGWISGEPIPVELGGLLLQLKDSSPRSPRTDVLIDINVLTEENIAAVKSMLKAASDFAREQNKIGEIESKAARMDPSVADVYRQLKLKEEANQAQAQIIDDRDQLASPAAEETKETAPAAAKKEDSAAPAEKPTPEAASQGFIAPMAMLPFCGRCGWDNRQKFETPVTTLDKQDFLAAILGNRRFKRDIELMGGKLIITFRTPLAEENKLIYRQLTFDQNAGRVVTEAEWFTRMIEYRLACSLERLSDSSGKQIAVVPEMSEFQKTHVPPPEEPLQTPLVPLAEYVNNNVLAHEVTRRLVGQHLRQFQRLVEALEAMALEPSFWSGIA